MHMLSYFLFLGNMFLFFVVKLINLKKGIQGSYLFTSKSIEIRTSMYWFSYTNIYVLPTKYSLYLLAAL